MPRSLKKGPFVDEHLLRKVVSQNESGSASKPVTSAMQHMPLQP